MCSVHVSVATVCQEDLTDIYYLPNQEPRAGQLFVTTNPILLGGA